MGWSANNDGQRALEDDGESGELWQLEISALRKLLEPKKTETSKGELARARGEVSAPASAHSVRRDIFFQRAHKTNFDTHH